ncbi:15174_t:CDS:2 [Acaulospora colombiana]|uniref:15174_t:CDS:1 n=1 Tax=Acaulospora colombiana TaxID=27376 RepID=A0ACA9MXT9_9GLOM|nr:15174_t:CDS:2 [Acaulospora colombiana]
MPFRIVDSRFPSKLLQTKTLGISRSSREIGFLTAIERIRGFSTNHKGPKRCWKCKSEIDYLSLHCTDKECGVIQKSLPIDVTYFEILRMHEDNYDPTPFDIDPAGLRRSFLRLQQLVHPDNYGIKDQQEYTYAQQQSSLINKAYQVLKDPLLRAQYMLQLNGVPIKESESMEDSELLMEILDTRERLEDATSDDEAKIIRNQSEAKIEEIIKNLSNAFKSNDLSEAKELTVKLQYWYNIRKAAIEWLPGKRVDIQH